MYPRVALARVPLGERAGTSSAPSQVEGSVLQQLCKHTQNLVPSKCSLSRDPSFEDLSLEHPGCPALLPDAMLSIGWAWRLRPDLSHDLLTEALSPRR